ncbi:hypothetical protein MLD52_02210 [Puniceicoccaceae bacterium K14]|nr:hypothetical protein [Puniceicoccaceae bacterium K14]
MIKLLTFTSFLACSSLAWSQSATAPTTRKPTSPTALQKYQSQKKGITLPNVTAILQWGPVSLRPHVDYEYSSVNGLNSNNEESNDTDIQKFSAGINFLLGEHWTLDYTSTWTRHSNDAFEDTRDDRLNLNGWAQTANWILNFSQSYTIDSSTQIESASQSESESFTTNIQGTRQLGRRTGLDLSLNYNQRDAEDFSGDNDYNNTAAISTMNWFRYENSQRLNTAIGAGIGYTDVEDGIDSSYQTAQVQANFQLTQKISLSASAGVETRQIKIEGSDTLTNPVFDAAINYDPFEQTQLRFSAGKTVNYSIFRDDIAERVSWTFDFSQRFLGRYFFDFSTSQRESDFIDSTNGNSVAESDTYKSFSYRLSTNFLNKGKIGVFYHSSDNESTIGSFEQNSYQTGVDVSYDF